MTHHRRALLIIVVICVTNHSKIHPIPILQEGLNVDFQGTDRVLELVLLQYGRVQDTEGTNHVLFATDADMDGGRVAGEVGRVCRNPVSMSTGDTMQGCETYHQAL